MRKGPNNSLPRPGPSAPLLIPLFCRNLLPPIPCMFGQVFNIAAQNTICSRVMRCSFIDGCITILLRYFCPSCTALRFRALRATNQSIAADKYHLKIAKCSLFGSPIENRRMAGMRNDIAKVCRGVQVTPSKGRQGVKCHYQGTGSFLGNYIM
jgi:hypothetical protein